MLNVRRWTFIFYQHLARYAVEEVKVAYPGSDGGPQGS
jgi:hypothetical protein